MLANGWRIVHLLEGKTYTSVKIERETDWIVVEGGPQAIKSFEAGLNSISKEIQRFEIALPVMERLLRNGGERIKELSHKIRGYVHVDTQKFALCLYGFPDDCENDKVGVRQHRDA